ncbi:MAG TPA: hypothetical protein VER96_37615 [Polyangiaceae bacterium]|nr:hypothetical protein [Polyangiaceae bacterium]
MATVAAEVRSNAPTETPILARSSDNHLSALPEDPEAGERSVAQWREHLREEERERRLGYDRRRLRQHREVIQRLQQVRQSYTAATNDAAIRRVQAQLKASIPKLEKSLDAIDHWRVSSTLVPEYAKLVHLFSEEYPEARIAALSGEKAALVALESEISGRFERIDEGLHEATESEDE